MIPAASPSQSRGIVHNDGPTVRHALQPAATSGDNPITATFHEHCRLVDPSTSHAAHVVTWLKSVGDRLLTSGEVALRAKVTYHLSDSPELSAFVAHVGDDARVVVSKGLLQKLIKNEDMLAAILGHELMHVHFRERFQESGERLAVTKVEEYVADVASISTWMIKAGYAPHQAVAVFDSLKEQTSPSGRNGERLLRPWIAFNDEHGLLENRAQAINALIAKEIKERGSVPVDVTPLTGEIKAAVAACAHVTYIEGIRRDPTYLQATPSKRYERLLVEIRDTTTPTRHRIPELATEFQNVLKECAVTTTTVEDVYTALKENKLGGKSEFLKLACREAQRQGRPGLAPADVREVAQVIRDFVAGRREADIISGAKKLHEFVTEWKGIDPGVRLVLASSFPSPSASEGDLPWERHLQLARTMMERGHPEILYALWMTGAYDTRLLQMASSQALEKFRDIPQLVHVKQSQNFTLSRSGSWERASGGEAAFLGAADVRSRYTEFVDAAVAERRHRKAISNHEIRAELDLYSTLGEVPADLLAKNLEGALSYFAETLAHPSQTTFHLSDRLGGVALPDWATAHDEDEQGTPVSDELAAHYASAVALRKKFEAMLSLEDPELRREASEKIRAFYLNTDGPCYATLIGFHPEDRISGEHVCRHPLTLFAAECPSLAAHERADFLRGLEHRLPSSVWTKAYFAGYRFADEREKLRHLQSVSVYQRSSQDLGAKLLVEIFAKLKIGKHPIAPIIAEHKQFFPAIRGIGDDERQILLDHIEAVHDWDAPLGQLVDVFWALEQAKLFPSAPSKVREILREKIIEGVAVIQDPVERQLMAERVLLSPLGESKRISDALRGDNISHPSARRDDAASKRDEALQQSATLLSMKDPVLRNAVTGAWSRAIREQISARTGHALEGRDDNTAAYIQITQPQLDDIVSRLRRRLPVQERRDMLGVLADELELQEVLSYRLRDGIIEHNRSGIMDGHEYFRSAEAGFEFLNQDPERRSAVVRFLSQPLTLENLSTFARRVDISRSREIQAVRDTLDALEESYQVERDKAEENIERLTYFTDQDRWLGTKFEVIEGHLKHTRDLSAMFSGDSLTDLIAEAIPEVVSPEARQLILRGIHFERVLPFEEAHQLAIRAGEQIVAANRAALSAEQATFHQTLQEALTELEGASAVQPVDVLRRKVLHGLANLPAYPFVETLEDRLSKATDIRSLETTIRRALNGLPKSFDREQAKGEAECAKELKRVLQSITSVQQGAQSELEEIEPLISAFQREANEFLASMPNITDAQESPVLHKVIGMKPAEVVDYLYKDESIESDLSCELEAIRLGMLRKADALSEGLPNLKERVQRIAGVRSEIEGRLPDLKKAPVPVIAVVEDASANLGEDEVFSAGGLMEEFSKLYPKKRRTCDLAVTPLEEQHARQLYELFWAQSAEIRSVALKLLILPPEAEYQDRRSGKDSHFKQAFDFVADQIFPANMRYGAESRKILRIFLEETDASLRGFMLAALMAASEKIAGAPEEYSAGKRLAMILSMLGPAEKKLGQAINSHPSTPEDLRSDTKSIKSMSDPLPRWDLLARIREAMPNEYAEVALPRVGQTLGAASYYIAVDCGESVLSILRPHARSLARSGLDRMHSIAVRLSHDPEMKHVAGPFIESIQQAREMIDLETDHQKGVTQQGNAWRRYDGLSVMVEDERFDFTTAAWKACGPEFRHQEKVKGEHFLDMLERVKADDPFLRKVALAHLTSELRNILSGDTFDHDRHGSQSKTQRGATTHSIGLFDHGCMALQAPSKEEKQELASILCNLVEGYMKGETGILQRAHEIIREKRERDGKIPSYLVSVERALLALNDFMRFDAKGESTLLRRSDLGKALAAVFKTGQVDPVFASTIASHFGGSGASMFVKLLSHQQLCAKIADKLEEQIGSKTSISIHHRAPRPQPSIIEFNTPRSEAASAA